MEGQREKWTPGTSIPTCRLPGIRRTTSLLHPARPSDGVATAGGKCHGPCVGTGTTCPPVLAGGPSPGRTTAGQQSRQYPAPLETLFAGCSPTSQTPTVATHPTVRPAALWAHRWLHQPTLDLMGVLIERGSTAASSSG